MKIGIVGHFGFGHEFLDGQTVKTKVLYNGLLEHVDSKTNIYCVDTYDNKVNKIRLFIKSIICILTCKNIILLLSGNGMRIYFPMMYYAKKILKRNIYHDVIGGNLAQIVERNPSYKKYLNGFCENWVEFEKMKLELEDIGITNCRVIPNFKNLHLENAILQVSKEKENTFCMFSRVMEEKGVASAVFALAEYNEKHEEKAKLEIWGPIEPQFQNDFENLLQLYNDFVAYKGCVPFDKSLETITDHIALLFPTFWKGEGFPGTIIDAFAAAVPVIATDWNANKELVDSFKTGLVYPNDEFSTLYECIEWSIENKDKLAQMRLNCINKANDFTTAKWIPYILDILNNQENFT